MYKKGKKVKFTIKTTINFKVEFSLFNSIFGDLSNGHASKICSPNGIRIFVAFPMYKYKYGLVILGRWNVLMDIYSSTNRCKSIIQDGKANISREREGEKSLRRYRDTAKCSQMNGELQTCCGYTQD